MIKLTSSFNLVPGLIEKLRESLLHTSKGIDNIKYGGCYGDYLLEITDDDNILGFTIPVLLSVIETRNSTILNLLFMSKSHYDIVNDPSILFSIDDLFCEIERCFIIFSNNKFNISKSILVAESDLLSLYGNDLLVGPINENDHPCEYSGDNILDLPTLVYKYNTGLSNRIHLNTKVSLHMKLPLPPSRMVQGVDIYNYSTLNDVREMVSIHCTDGEIRNYALLGSHLEYYGKCYL